MEIEVGEYIRTTDGYIRKIHNINTDKNKITIFGKYRLDVPYKNSYSVAEKKIKSHSKNIIDLIQCGDFVNGHLVFDKAPNCVYIEDNQNKLAHIPYTKEKIKSVVTKEQYEQNSYKL